MTDYDLSAFWNCADNIIFFLNATTINILVTTTDDLKNCGLMLSSKSFH